MKRDYSGSSLHSFESCVSEAPRRTLRLGLLATKGYVAILAGTATICAIVYVYYHPLWDMAKRWWITSGQYINSEWWIIHYGSIPVVAAIVGWGTNAIAISMTFYPLEFIGCCRSCQLYGMPICGWQGIIPSNCKRMADGAVEKLTTQMFNARDAVNRLDSARIATELRPALEQLTIKIVDTIALEYAPRTWAQLPPSVKLELQRKCLEKSSDAITVMMGEAHSDISSLFDLREILVDLLVRDKQLVNEIFLKMAGKEYEFIRVSGLYLGFIFGLGQMALWSQCHYWWILPFAGFLVGYLTNFVALKCIFKPVHPYYICGFKVQGLFIKRQKEVAAVYAHMFSSTVLNAENLLQGMINSSSSDALFEVLDENVKQGIDSVAKQVMLSRRVAKVVIGPEQYIAMKGRVCQLIRADITSFFPYVTPSLNEAMDVRATLEQAMGGLSYEDFANLMLPAFREGELKLIIIGGVLGAAVGMAQAVVQVPHQLGLPARVFW